MPGFRKSAALSIAIAAAAALSAAAIPAKPGRARTKAPNRCVPVVAVSSLRSGSAQSRMLAALDAGDLATVRSLAERGGAIDQVLCFGEEQSPCPRCAAEVDMRAFSLGRHIWIERPAGSVRLAETFWRAYPRAADGSYGYGSIRIYGTPLMAAARARNVKMVEFLLRLGANPNVFVKLADGQWLYALREPFVNAAGERDVEKAKKICRMLSDAGAVAMSGDDLKSAVALSSSASRAIDALREEENRLVADMRMRQADLARKIEMMELRNRSDRVRAEIEVEKIRQKDKELLWEETRRECARVTNQTLGQYDTAGRLGLIKCSPGTHSDLYRNSSGDVYKVDVQGNARKINPADGSLGPVE